jgi:uncharacterized FlaG/YvyC family protein
MNTKRKFKLIEGNFTPQEAGIMLYDLIASKIQFHNRESLSIQLKTNGDISNSKNRVEQLKDTREQMEQFINYAKENNLKLEISADIEIKLVKINNNKTSKNK